MENEQSLEDYLETIHILRLGSAEVHQVEVARRLGVSQPAVNKAIRKLKDADYVRTEGMHIFLTESGAKRAEEIYGKHCNIRDFLMRLGVDEKVAETDACIIEHVVSDGTYAAICKYLENN